MSYLRKDTLAYHRSRPLLVAQNLRAMPLKQVVAAMNKYMNAHPGHVSVEESALTFYMLNHAFACVAQKFGPHEPLGEFNKIANEYIEQVNQIAVRAMYYVLIICARESRHVHKTAGLKNKAEKACGAGFYAFQMAMPDDPNGAVNYFRQNPPPDMSFGDYCKALVWLFEKGTFSTSYGGPKWAQVAKTLKMLACGEGSAELFVDQVWALRHNTAPIFNKGMLYNHDKPELNMVLDVQRAGMIPQLVSDSISGNGGKLDGVTDKVKSQYQLCAGLLESEFLGYVDWVLVKERGALHDYSHKIKAQVKVHGVPASATAAEVLEAKKYYVTEDEYAVAIERKDLPKAA